MSKFICIFPGDPTVAGHLKPCEEVLQAVEKSLKSAKYNGYAPSTGNSFTFKCYSICSFYFRDSNTIIQYMIDVVTKLCYKSYNFRSF